ncbi:eIF2A-related protein [Leptolyngbya sp. FACHB-261]|uniref:nSTAND1 domain-containing NTPase n=1 Tax=Leptolyngbya sp. FACHB-261 TaxID=2692806 RepID=UPI0016897A21|nr:caspase family protein [Leptolyngbya sp. FACHB-261]MBD2101495.1 caspase family protein [Leptolyngbya sp. FACHB-261]
MARYALVIGIAEYDSSRLPTLNKAVRDAEAVARLLEQHGDFYEVRRLPRRWLAAENRYEVAPKRVTGDELFKVLKEFLEQAANQEALIYFAGHGFRIASRAGKQRGFLATSDCTVDGRNAISLDDDLNELVRQANLSNLVVLLDCCHAGALLEADLELNRNLVEPSLSAFVEKRDYYLITACRAGQVAYEDAEHGVFTGAVLQGLSQDNAYPDTGQVSGNRLFEVVYQRLQGTGQEPFQMGIGRLITIVTYPKALPVTDEIDESVVPYRGLEPFEKEQAQFFFGRKKVVEEIWQKLDRGRFVAVIGASGSGKSSVVRAGLVPWLEAAGWTVLDPIKPGDEPLTELRVAFKQAFQDAPEQIQQLGSVIRNAQEGLQGLIERLPGTGKFLLVVDQFEEVFTVCTDADDCRRFIQLVTQVAGIPASRLAVVITMRADFLEPCLQHESLTRLLQSQAVYMPPLAEADLIEAIVKPAQKQGYELKSDLLGEILKDTREEPGFLPLLQFALTELWEQRDRQTRQLALDAYRDIGRLAGALNHHADNIFLYSDYLNLQSNRIEKSPKQEREQQEKDWIRGIFLRLVRTSEGERDTRQRQPRSHLSNLAGTNPEACTAINRVLDTLLQGRLLVIGESERKAKAVADLPQEARDNQVIDLAHEALIKGWQRLDAWCQESRELRRLRQRLEAARQDWEEDHQNDKLLAEQKQRNLMMGGLLAEVREHWADLKPYLQSPEEDELFYQCSDTHEQDRIAELQRALTVARLQEQAARALYLVLVQARTGLELALQTLGENLEKSPNQLLASVQSSLNRAMTTARVPDTFQGHEADVWSVSFSPDGQTIVSGSGDGTIRLWDVRGNAIGQPFKGHQATVGSVSFSPDGQAIVSGSTDGTIRLWDVWGNAIGQPFKGHQATVSSVSFSPDGQAIVSGCYDGTIRLWDVWGNAIGQPFEGHEGYVSSVAFSPDGQTIVSGSTDGTIRLWDVRGNAIGQPFEGHEGYVSSVAFSPDGQTIVSGSTDGTIRLWDLRGNAIGQPFKGHEGYVWSVSFSPDGQTIVSGGYDKTIRLWDLRGNAIGQPFEGHEGYVSSVAFSPDGQAIVSGSDDKTIRLWDVRGNAIGQPFEGHEADVWSVSFSPDGQTIASGSEDKTIRLWDVRGNAIGQPFEGHEGYVSSVAFSPDGQRIVSGSEDKTIRLWDLRGNVICQPFEGHEDWVMCVAFSPDGQRIVSGSTDGTIRLWDVRGNAIGQPFEGHEADVWSVSFSPDGQTIVSGSEDKTIRLWDVRGNAIGQPFQGHEADVWSVSFSPDGQTIASGSRDKTIRLWDVRGNAIGQPFEGHEGYVSSVSFSPDGQTIVSGSRDKTIRLWDVRGNAIGQPFQGHRGYVGSVSFSPDGQTIVSGSEDKTIRLWRGNWQSWLKVCCNRLRDYRTFRQPTTEAAKAACAVCQKYVWDQEDAAVKQ